jgi:hypothetical protein
MEVQKWVSSAKRVGNNGDVIPEETHLREVLPARCTESGRHLGWLRVSTGAIASNMPSFLTSL